MLPSLGWIQSDLTFPRESGLLSPHCLVSDKISWPTYSFKNNSLFFFFLICVKIWIKSLLFHFVSSFLWFLMPTLRESRRVTLWYPAVTFVSCYREEFETQFGGCNLSNIARNILEWMMLSMMFFLIWG